MSFFPFIRNLVVKNATNTRLLPISARNLSRINGKSSNLARGATTPYILPGLVKQFIQEPLKVNPNPYGLPGLIKEFPENPVWFPERLGFGEPLALSCGKCKKKKRKYKCKYKKYKKKYKKYKKKYKKCKCAKKKCKKKRKKCKKKRKKCKKKRKKCKKQKKKCKRKLKKKCGEAEPPGGSKILLSADDPFPPKKLD